MQVCISRQFIHTNAKPLDLSRYCYTCRRSVQTLIKICPQTGVALAALFKLVERGQVSPQQRVVIVSTAHGLKFTGFKVGFHEGALAEVAARHANPPLELPAEVDVVRRAIEQVIGVET